ncbi:transcriptional regulator, LytR/AlgR family [Candidatus Koribacter versatilis Ellin345]|uniref:Transcriptional regulator, LytR/AlgR family n=1 Tax=Koribacter versatilis (strain Ellin345) TaxID=204669 RepID=Q1IJW2_KORVE|nr:LytTR family DNA-binding domain-containing protein [Candidatus Koribacter versatilis]ABF42838.1 transcriptional regulator, LytR/AlgR family [Candidatus Koribacter versatilis Ellin345]
MSPAPIRVITVDDEPFALQRISRLVREEPSLSLVAECSSAASAIESICELRPQVVFLDVQMPEVDGFGVLDAFQGPTLPWVVFTTAYEEYAVRAFEASAVDYLLKPISQERFSAAVGKLKTAANSVGTSNARSGLDASRYERILIKTDGKFVMLDPGQVERISAAGNYAIVYAAGKSYIIRETMTRIQCRVDPRRFFRVNRSEIVNLSFVQELEPTCHGEYSITTIFGTKVTLTRTYRDALQRMLSMTRSGTRV